MRNALPLLLTAWVLVDSGHSSAEQPSLADGALVARTVYDLPSYNDASGVRPYADEAEYAEAIGDRRFVLERLTYASDGLPVVAYAYGPRRPEALSVPMLLMHGGADRDIDPGQTLALAACASAPWTAVRADDRCR